MPNTLFLFDMDGVLIYPGGYKEALRATVDHFALLMGQPPINLTMGEIAEFEACGITNEWDSSRMCVGATLVDVLLRQPDLAGKAIDDTFRSIRDTGASINRPDFAGLARGVSAHTPHSVPPTETIDQLIRQRAGGRFGAILDGLMGDIYSLQTPTTRILQHFTLGSERFRQTYGLEPEFDTESRLVTHDRPLLSQEMIDKLLAYAKPGRPGMAIYTARPSLPPGSQSGSRFVGIGGSRPPHRQWCDDLAGRPTRQSPCRLHQAITCASPGSHRRGLRRRDHRCAGGGCAVGRRESTRWAVEPTGRRGHPGGGIRRLAWGHPGHTESS